MTVRAGQIDVDANHLRIYPCILQILLNLKMRNKSKLFINNRLTIYKQ